jgi:hypothetical protein
MSSLFVINGISRGQGNKARGGVRAREGAGGLGGIEPLKGLSYQIFKSFSSSMILNQYFLYGR